MSTSGTTKKATATFVLKRDIRSQIRNYGGDKGFAVTVDGQPVYYGRFHPAYLSSLTIGVPTIDPILTTESELSVQFTTIQGSSGSIPDPRNDSRLLNALKESGRLR